MKLREIMNRYPATVTRTDTLITARDRMVWAGVRHLPVVDGARVVGVISDRDIANHQAQTGESLFSSPEDTVDMAMSTPAHTAGPDDTVIEAMARVSGQKIGCLPITDKGELIGMVTVTDLLAAEVRQHVRAPAEKTGATVGEVMTRDPQIVRSGDRLLDAAARMQQSMIRHLPVVDAEGRVIGMLSDRDVRGAIGDPGRVREGVVPDIEVGVAMTGPAMTVTPSRPVVEVAQMFAGLGAGAFPVVDDDLHIVGIISYVDVLVALTE